MRKGLWHMMGKVSLVCMTVMVFMLMMLVAMGIPALTVAAGMWLYNHWF